MLVKKAMNIDFNDIQFYPPLIKDYLNGTLREQSIINWDYSTDSILKKSSARNFKSRKILVKQLQVQNKGIVLTNESSTNIEKLSKENTFTVCTGHQLCIYGGPAYFYSKILDVIKLVNELNGKQSNNHYVPVFWLASEDHDFEEISQLNLFNSALKWENNSKGGVGQINTESLKELHTQFCEIVGKGTKAENLINIFNQAYSSGKNLAEATRHFVNSVFGQNGLVIIDGNDTELKQLLSPVVSKEIKNSITESIVNQSIDTLHKYKIQVKPRTINLFYFAENYRERLLVKDDHIFTVDNKHSWTIKDFLELTIKHPERISPNVLLRPVYQELCLPNVAYIGGAGEISYWLELPQLFKALAIPFPLPVVRNSYLYLTEKQLNKISALGLKPADLYLEEGLLIKKHLEQTSSNKFDLLQEKEDLERLFNKIQSKSEVIDKDLTKVVSGELKRSLSAMDNMEKRFRNAEKNKNTAKTNQIIKLKAVAYPNNVYQERTKSFLEFDLQTDIALTDVTLSANIPLDNSIKVVVY